MSWHRMKLQDIALTPWRNGLGTTRELVAFPVRDHWHWRLSVSDIEQDGPFSCFEGVERWFAVLEGDGLRLAIDGSPHLLTRESQPLDFDASAQTLCEIVGGPTRNFNLMVRQGRPSMERVRGEVAKAVSSGSAIALWSGTATARVTFEGNTVELDPGMLAWRHLDLGGRVELCATDGLWVEVAP